MSYRFTNRGEKSDLQKVYEWINKQPIGTDFNIHSIMAGAGVPQNTASASLAFLTGNGMLEKQKEKTRLAGKSNPVSVYRFVKKIDKREHSKPKEHTRVVIKLKPKIAKEKIKIETTKVDLEKLKKITNALFECCVELEIFMTEIQEAKNGKISASVRPTPQLPIRDRAPQKDS